MRCFQSYPTYNKLAKIWHLIIINNSNNFYIVFNGSRDLEYFNKDNVDSGKKFRKSEKTKKTFKVWIIINEEIAWSLAGTVIVSSSGITKDTLLLACTCVEVGMCAGTCIASCIHHH